MPSATLEERMSAVEAELAEIKRRLPRRKGGDSTPWWERHFGAFKDDPAFESAVRLGEEYRKAQPNPADSPDAVTF